MSTNHPIYLCVHQVGDAVVVSTTLPEPRLGAKLTDTEAVALSLCRAAKHLTGPVDHTPRNVPAWALAQDLTDTDMYGLDIPTEVKRHALRVRGVDQDGINIDRIHALREGAAL